MSGPDTSFVDRQLADARARSAEARRTVALIWTCTVLAVGAYVTATFVAKGQIDAKGAEAIAAAKARDDAKSESVRSGQLLAKKESEVRSANDQVAMLRETIRADDKGAELIRVQTEYAAEKSLWTEQSSAMTRAHAEEVAGLKRTIEELPKTGDESLRRNLTECREELGRVKSELAVQQATNKRLTELLKQRRILPGRITDRVTPEGRR